jgi:hypothetical protein|tara:strand:+ start:188 stop:613 length:426 start_codon:yes stop_codon:yes gene_type:complete
MIEKKWFSLLKEVLSKPRKNRMRTKVSAMTHNLTAEQLESLFVEQFETCPYTSVELRFKSASRNSAGDRKKNRNLSVDRIDSDKAYTKENCELVTKIIQKMKGELTPKEFYAVCRRVADIADMREIERMPESQVDSLIDQY